MDTRAQDNRVVTQAGVGATLVGLGMLPGLVWLATLSWPWCQRQDSVWKCVPLWAMLGVCLALVLRLVHVDRCVFDLANGEIRHWSLGPGGLRRSKLFPHQVAVITSDSKLGVVGSKYHRHYARFYRLLMVLHDGRRLQLSPYDRDAEVLQEGESLARLLSVPWRPPEPEFGTPGADYSPSQVP